MSYMHNPAHPGRILKEAISDCKMTVTAFAAHIGVSRVTLTRILSENAGVTPAMSIKLGQALNCSSALWFNMQAQHDFWVASQKKSRKIKPVAALAA